VNRLAEEIRFRLQCCREAGEWVGAEDGYCDLRSLQIKLEEACTEMKRLTPLVHEVEKHCSLSTNAPIDDIVTLELIAEHDELKRLCEEGEALLEEKRGP